MDVGRDAAQANVRRCGVKPWTSGRASAVFRTVQSTMISTAGKPVRSASWRSGTSSR